MPNLDAVLTVLRAKPPLFAIDNVTGPLNHATVTSSSQFWRRL
jgi:hypothetical protein